MLKEMLSEQKRPFSGNFLNCRILGVQKLSPVQMEDKFAFFEAIPKRRKPVFVPFLIVFGDLSCWGGGGLYTREMGTICPLGVFSPVLQYCLLQNWPFSL